MEGVLRVEKTRGIAGPAPSAAQIWHKFLWRPFPGSPLCSSEESALAPRLLQATWPSLATLFKMAAPHGQESGLAVKLKCGGGWVKEARAFRSICW